MTADNIDGSLDTATHVFGLDDAPYLVKCPTCEGSGKAYATRFSALRSVCRECMGLGEVEAP